MDVGDRRLKENVKNFLKENLLEVSVLQPKSQDGGTGLHMADVSGSEVGLSTGLIFEQCKELLLLQVEIKKLELEGRRLSLTNMDNVGQVSGSPGPLCAFDVAKSLRLVPQFCELDPDTFFLLFERVEFGLTLSAHYCCSVF